MRCVAVFALKKWPFYWSPLVFDNYWASFCCTKNWKKLHLFAKSCIYTQTF